MSQTWKEKIEGLKAAGVELDLPTLLALAKTHEMTPEEYREQRRSWVIGNLLLSNPSMRRDRAERLVKEAEEKYGL